MQWIIAMPMYNESDGIAETFKIIEEAFAELGPLVIVLQDDCSSDNSVNIASEQSKLCNFSILIESNQANLGHGQTLFRAYERALELNPKFVLQLDSDGQFEGRDLKSLAQILINADCSLVLGARKKRQDPSYRRMITYATRVLIFLQTRRDPIDPNSPIRGYLAEDLREAMKGVPRDSPIPNVLLTRQILRSGGKTSWFAVRHRVRRGVEANGTMWGRGSNLRKALRFFRFAIFAMRSAMSDR